MSPGAPVIAVVDDDPQVLESLQELLESAEFIPRTFSSGAALLAAGLAEVDVLITDIGLPDMDGFELQSCVEDHYPHVPVFLISGRHEKSDRKSLQPERHILRKPFDGNALLEAIRQALAKRDCSSIR
ncbi:FixJ family two-component response regulator [Agrobacterium tumefaciens]|uniref:FixJ family two-component response regulator n=1 Tax=Agrobacterium radiobacter TaxID=362 RepID=A0ABR6JE17_AGRRD|nr:MULTISPECIES: response regulator [Agrobacterium tumefaciens complex]MCP2138098.1 FixJ family two-component response regulator [Rhizobium sp. SLBN-94]MBB4321182.1 FixJ family two-component response regulator [Agrobacterium radiobacter]MBB4338222.1 FixJ family two-component response regulator [Agrobacterium radiobacter]MBB4493110.1 FixJ family two-component response regulator [Agrobacterium radiobacter]MBB4498383.1 FixJ family two-component response regulator [Agrobacterium radiobacter]